MKKESEYLTKRLNETASEFVEYASEASSRYDFSLEGCNHICTELLLVSSIGLKGVYLLKTAAEEIPVNCPNKLSIITASALTSKSITEEMCEEFLEGSLSTIGESLLKVKESTAAYLTPPVCGCIQECYLNGRLVRHHGPVDATIFTLQRPKTVKKQSLKCEKCSIIYGYSMCGTDGE